MTRIAIIVGAVVLAVGGVALLSWTAADSRTETERLQEQVETERRIDNADTGSGDADADREWLRQRAE